MNLSEAAVAGAAGLTVSSYGDVEAYDNEWADVPLGHLRLIGDKLQLDICSLIQPNTSALPPSAAARSRSVTIADAFSATGRSITEISDEIGVIEAAVQKLLSDPDSLDTWPLEFVLSLCLSLNIPLRAVFSPS